MDNQNFNLWMDILKSQNEFIHQVLKNNIDTITRHQTKNNINQWINFLDTCLGQIRIHWEQNRRRIIENTRLFFKDQSPFFLHYQSNLQNHISYLFDLWMDAFELFLVKIKEKMIMDQSFIDYQTIYESWLERSHLLKNQIMNDERFQTTWKNMMRNFYKCYEG